MSLSDISNLPSHIYDLEESGARTEDMAEIVPRFSMPTAFFWLLCLNWTVTVAIVTGAGAFAGEAGVGRSLWMTLAGWCLAVGGFSLDFYAERDLDVGGHRAEIHHNPLANRSLSPLTGLVFYLTSITAIFIITLIVCAGNCNINMRRR